MTTIGSNSKTYAYLVDGYKNVFLIDNEAKTVKKINVTKRQLTKNKIAYYWTNNTARWYFEFRGFDVKGGGDEFEFEEHIFSKVQVQCDICHKYSVSEDNYSEQKAHLRNHFFRMQGDELKYFKRVAQ